MHISPSIGVANELVPRLVTAKEAKENKPSQEISRNHPPIAPPSSSTPSCIFIHYFTLSAHARFEGISSRMVFDIKPLTPPLDATHQALAVTELLEAILVNLSTADTRCYAQRVSKRWHDCFDGSLQIGRKCFLVANILEEEVADDRLYLNFDHPAFVQYNPTDRGMVNCRKWLNSQNVIMDKIRMALLQSPFIHLGAMNTRFRSTCLRRNAGNQTSMRTP